MKRLAIKRLGPSTFIGTGLIALLLVLGLVSNSFLPCLGLAFFILMLTGLYTVVTGRRSWVHLAGRRAGGIVLAVGAVASMASLAAFGASLPERDTSAGQPGLAPATASPAASPSPSPTTSAAASPSPSPTTSAAASPSPSPTASAGASPLPNNSTTQASLSAPFGQAITFPSGFSVKISYLGRFTPGPYAFGAEDGKITLFEYAVKNGTDRKINMLFSSNPRFTYGPDRTEATVAGDVTLTGDNPDVIFPTLEPGQEATLKVVSGIPEKGLNDVQATIYDPDFWHLNLGDESARPAIFEGPLE